jgi:Xaa-Pro aminopeptidase
MNRQETVAKVRREITERDIDALLITSPVNVRYVSGFTGSDSVLLLTDRQQLLITDFRYSESARGECPDWEVVEHPGVSRADWVERFAGREGLQLLGLEADHLSWQQYRRLSEAAPRVCLAPTIGLVEKLRTVKSPWEVERVRRALRAGERAFEALRELVRPGVTEKALADELETLLRRQGASESGFETIVAFGPASSIPHARAGSRRLARRQTVLVDWGARVESYNSDLTRVLATGRVTSKFERIYRVVLEAQAAGIDAVAPGVRAAAVDAAARRVITEAGFGERFGHGLGHGVGLEVHEAPTLNSRSEDVLMPGMVLTIEPGIYIPGWGGIRIEDMVLVTDQGHSVLSRLDKGPDSVGLS